MARPSIWHLELSIFPSGSHWYATLVGPRGSRRELEHRLSAKEALALNRWTSDYRYKPGERCKRFFSQQQARDAALKAWSGRGLLLEGGSSCLDPHPILAGGWPQLEGIQEDFAALGDDPYRDDPLRADELSKQWDLELTLAARQRGQRELEA